MATPTARPGACKQWLWFAAIAGIVLAALFHRSFGNGEILFVNDLTFGLMKSPANQLPAAFTGNWQPDIWLGGEGPATAPTVSALLAMIFPPEIYLKLYAPFTLFFAGFCAWIFFRQLEFHPVVCLLGGLATALNMHFFSIACWGLGLWNMAAGMIFLALAVLCSKSIRQTWARGILAGLCIGLGLMEGNDVGAILSLYAGIFIAWQAWSGRKIAAGLGLEFLAIFFAALIAAHSISTLVSTQVSGTVWSSSNQNAATSEERWAPATQWSLPKTETLGVLMPGLFGYRMIDRIEGTDKSGAYWGTVGRDPRIVDLKSDDPATRAGAIGRLILPPPLQQALASPDPAARNQAIDRLTRGSPSAMRFSGNGEYAGVLVSILAILGLALSCLRDGGPLTVEERRAVWFWGAAALLSLLAAWGRYGFLYRWLYALPGASAIRNPIKFLHPFHMAWIILAGYGMEGLWRRVTVPGFRTKWIAASLAFAGLALTGLFIYHTKTPDLIGWLSHEGFDPATPAQIADFSVAAARWFVLLFCIGAGLVTFAMTGIRTRVVWGLLGLAMMIDLARADVPWIRYFNYQKTYAANPLLEFLQDQPWEHRVTGRISPRGLGAGLASPLGQLYYYWLQNDFAARGIESLDWAQWTRTPEMDLRYLDNFALKGNDLPHADLWLAERLWELSNTRYILTDGMFVAPLNRAADVPDPFHVVTQWSVTPKPGVERASDPGDMTVAPDENGPYALIEFTNALPRAQLFSRWATPTNDDATLQTLLSRDFDPHRTVLISADTPPPQAPSAGNPEAGTVRIVNYRPKHVLLKAHAGAPSVLLLNDRFAPNWQVLVDEKPAGLLRCNYIMRGVFVPAGDHVVEFCFRPRAATLCLSLCGWAVGILTAAYVAFKR
jgi:hypothetical protein